MKEGRSVLTMGQERLRSDRRQLGGMLLALGICITFQPLAGMESFIGHNFELGGTRFSTIWVLCAGIVQIVFGTLAMVVGYLALVHDYGDRRLTGVLIAATLLAWIPFLTGIIQVGVAASGPYVAETKMSGPGGAAFLEEYVVNPFVPEDYLPNKTDILFLGCMGILGLITYGIGFFGSLAFVEFALYSFDTGKPTRLDARYYRRRLLLYSFVILIAGMSQILFGAYALFEFGGGRLSPPIGVAMYRVSFPAVTVAVGSIQMLVGYYGVGSYLRLFPIGPDDNNFQAIAFGGWLLQLILQYIVQWGFAEGNEDPAALTSVALYSFGMNILPAFLDYKMRNTPYPLRDEYYDAINAEEEIMLGTGIATRDEILENVKTLEIRDGFDDNSGVDLRHQNQHKPGTTTVKTIEHPHEPGITVEEIVEYPTDFGTAPDNKATPRKNTVGPFLEPGNTVEEYVEYPDGQNRKGDDDEDTPPRSNESFSTDMEDTWGAQSPQQMLLPSIEENSSRIIFDERKEWRPNGGERSSTSRQPIQQTQNANANSPASRTIPERYYDYDSDDEGFEISEATPDDDTAALDAKIEKLKGEFVSDTNLETYLNKIM